MDLGLEITRTIGRQERKLEPEFVRLLDSEDLKELEKERGVQKPRSLSDLKRLSERHRNLARLIAAGKEDWELSAITGYTVSHISILKSDPAMKNLIRHYSEEVDIVYTQVNEKLANVAGTALDIIQDRLEDPEQAAELSIGQLAELTKLGADRTGNGPTTKSEVNVQVNIADRLEAARKRALQARLLEAKTIDHE
jgi:hypothetical protein